jgi:hypothetical protein
MATPKAYVISQTETSYVVLDETTKSYTVLEKPYELGAMVKLPSGVEVQLSTMDVTPTKMFYALKEHEYNLTRKKKKYEAIKAQKPVKAAPKSNTIPLLG